MSLNWDQMRIDAERRTNELISMLQQPLPAGLMNLISSP